MPNSRIAILIPIGPQDESWRSLSACLVPYAASFEIIWSSTDSKSVGVGREVVGEPGRAKQLNRAAGVADAEWFWFVHSDSTLSKLAIEKVLNFPLDKKNLYFCELKFRGTPLMRINEFGVWFRSRFLKMPFGDQGLLIHRDLFWRLGGFDEAAAYGEDHLLVWKARRAGAGVKPLGVTMITSARKYEKNGWLVTTGKHNYLTWKQAIPEIMKKEKRRGAIAVFVKTPGLSPIKTRLAKSVGEKEALRFYRKSLEKIKTVVENSLQNSAWEPYWAIAEENASEGQWPDWKSVWQGTGELGTRLAQVQETLLEDHAWVVFLGGDCPLVTPELLKEAMDSLESGKSRFVLGEAEDGGFYLYGGGRGVSRALWEGVPYSSDVTSRELRKALAPLGTIKDLPKLLDVDTESDWMQMKTLCPEVFDQ